VLEERTQGQSYCPADAGVGKPLLQRWGPQKCIILPVRHLKRLKLEVQREFNISSAGKSGA